VGAYRKGACSMALVWACTRVAYTLVALACMVLVLACTLVVLACKLVAYACSRCQTQIQQGLEG